MRFDFGDSAMVPLVKPVVHEMQYDSPSFVDTSLSAMDELIKMTLMDNPLWIKSLNGGMESLNIEENMGTFSSSIGMKPSSYTIEATRATGLLYLCGLALVEDGCDMSSIHLFQCLR
ncbi:hypothetical protein V6N11_084178 [Hibiscus sabdariffa]|uniref:START domain-containing protein n=1 Tax=Hibiscus sabdariffa TaxID=183260 RepID=A0ABR2QS94_9ROSI